MNAFLVAVDSENPDQIFARMPGGDQVQTWQNRSFAAYANGDVASLNSKLAIETLRGPIAFVGRLALANRHLLERGKHDAALSDEKLCLKLYKAHGIEFLRAAVGHYAFTIWDGRDRTLYCARDALGTVPLCYARGRGGEFFVASDVRSILQTGAVNARINEAKIADFLIMLEGSDHVETFYANVNRLPPGQLLTCRNGELTQSVCDEIAPAEVSNSISDNEAIGIYRDKLASAVGRCIDKEKSFGCTLSGGLDSTIVAIETKMVAESRGLPMRTYSVNVGSRKFESVSGEDKRCIDALVKHLGFDSQVLTPDDLNGASIEDWCRHADDLFDFSMGGIRTILTRAKSQNVSTVLDGVEGDLVASLNRDYIDYLVRSGRWLRAMVESPLSVRRQQGQPLLTSLRRGVSRYRSARNGSGIHNAPADPVEAYLPTTLVNRDFAKQVALEERIRRWEGAKPRLGRDLKNYHATTLGESSLTAAFERYDRVPRDAGVCLRHPLLDRELVEFLIGCPWHMKNRWGWNKFLVRNAFESELPSSVVWRRKFDNVLPIFNFAGEEHLLMRGRELLFSSDDNSIWRFVDRKLFRKYSEKPKNLTENINVLLVIALAIWIQRA